MAAGGAVVEEAPGGYRIRKRYGYRDWEVWDPAGELVCITVYRRGAREVVGRLCREEAQEEQPQAA
jgi:hypothetical protein